MNANQAAGCAIDPKRLVDWDSERMTRLMAFARNQWSRLKFAGRRERFLPLYDQLEVRSPFWNFFVKIDHDVRRRQLQRQQRRKVR